MTDDEDSSTLTNKQQRFVEEYLVDLNGKQAAIRAGYAERSAEVAASRLLSNDKVASAVKEAMDKRSQRTNVTADMVVQELARIGFSDLRKVISANGSLLFPSEWDDNTAASISSIEVVTRSGDKGEDDEGRKIIEHTHKIKVWDKNSALEKLGKHLGMFAEHVNVSGEVKHVHKIDRKIVNPFD